MAAALDVFDSDLREKVKSSRVLVIGAGGIGCELLKCIVLSGFRDVDIIDLDTIDVSNLNRQFLFQKQHVGKSKSKVARDSVQKLNPDAKITAHHGSVMSPDFGPDYFKQFNIVLNALDNRAARNHVNRICLAADVPLIESGTAGYLGQVTVIKKGETECYECQPKATQKSYPGCTIRNTPSEPIHCIVWAKHLFNQLFGEDDPDEDVSPDTADPEAAGDAGNKALETDANDAGNVKRISTRSWAISTGYDVNRIIHKLFHDDIKYLLSMDGLWQKRRPPTPLDVSKLPDAVAGSSRSLVDISEMRDQRLWSVKECIDVLKTSVSILKERLDAMSLTQDGSTSEGEFLVWDKDDDPCMDFVTACANVRAHIFGIAQKSRFDVKSMAGNIIPAIATTNAIIAGLIVMEALKILNGMFEDCKTVYLNRQPNPKGKLLVPCMLVKPNPKCAVCSAKPEVSVKLNTGTFTVGNLESKILKGHLNMVAPDVTIEDGKGTILISSEEGETEGNNCKFLSDFGIRNGTQLMCDDYVQIYKLVINIIHCNEESLRDGQDFEVVGDIDQLKADQSENEKQSDNGESSNHKTSEEATSVGDDDDDDDLMVVEDMNDKHVENIVIDVPVVKKRPASDGEGSSEDVVATKKVKHGGSDGDDVIVIM